MIDYTLQVRIKFKSKDLERDARVAAAAQEVTSWLRLGHVSRLEALHPGQINTPDSRRIPVESQSSLQRSLSLSLSLQYTYIHTPSTVVHDLLPGGYGRLSTTPIAFTHSTPVLHPHGSFVY